METLVAEITFATAADDDNMQKCSLTTLYIVPSQFLALPLLLFRLSQTCLGNFHFQTH